MLHFVDFCFVLVAVWFGLVWNSYVGGVAVELWCGAGVEGQVSQKVLRVAAVDGGVYLLQLLQKLVAVDRLLIHLLMKLHESFVFRNAWSWPGLLHLRSPMAIERRALRHLLVESHSLIHCKILMGRVPTYGHFTLPGFKSHDSVPPRL